MSENSIYVVFFVCVCCFLMTVVTSATVYNISTYKFNEVKNTAIASNGG